MPPKGPASWGSGNRVRRLLAGEEFLSPTELAARAEVSLATARRVLTEYKATGKLESGTAPSGRIGWRVRREIPAHLLLGTAEVPVSDLDTLLSHFYDEVLGCPDRSHWRLPRLREAADRLAEATRPPGADVHPVLRREIRQAAEGAGRDVV